MITSCDASVRFSLSRTNSVTTTYDTQVARTILYRVRHVNISNATATRCKTSIALPPQSDEPVIHTAADLGRPATPATQRRERAARCEEICRALATESVVRGGQRLIHERRIVRQRCSDPRAARRAFTVDLVFAPPKEPNANSTTLWYSMHDDALPTTSTR